MRYDKEATKLKEKKRAINWFDAKEIRQHPSIPSLLLCYRFATVKYRRPLLLHVNSLKLLSLLRPNCCHLPLKYHYKVAIAGVLLYC